METENKLFRDFFLGFIKIHILHHAAKEKIYAQEFQNELARHGYKISFGTLYPIFHKLHNEKYLKIQNENVNGKIRKYYSITAKGLNTLETAKQKCKELFNEIY